MESDDGCSWSYDSYSSGWSNNTSWFYQSYGYSTSSCATEFEYVGAEAHDDDGELASLSAGGEQGNQSDYTWSHFEHSTPDRSTYDHSSSWSASSWWSRDATVDTRAGSVSASDFCSSNGTSAYSDSYSSFGSYQSGSYSSSSGDASQCGIAATSDAAGLPADAFAGESCSSRDGSHDAWSPSWNASYASAASSCIRGARADAAGESASAGVGHSCDSSSSSYATSGHSYYSDWSRCRNGVFASGPDGMVLFAGVDDSAWTWCGGSGECEGDAWQGIGMSLDWQNSPLGPHGTHLWYTLP